MTSFEPQELSTGKLHSYLLCAVAPRPIAFASTIDKAGNPNLSPFSFFNVFSANPPIMIFSPARRVRDNTTKHTLENVLVSLEDPKAYDADYIKSSLRRVEKGLHRFRKIQKMYVN